MTAGMIDVRHWLPVMATIGAVACGPQIELEGQESGGVASGSGDPTDSSPTADDADSSTGAPPVPTARQVDIIFVVDNSGSMGEEQAKLATSIGNLLVALDGVEPPVDYRIAVTTTDNGNPWCAGTSPEAGSFRSTSCLGRLSEFVFEGATVEDAAQIACQDVCVLEELGLPDAWIDVERSTGTTNVPGDVVLDALRCMLPQGINGCGFEQPLESMYKAILRTETVGEASYGFHRDGALLAVAIVTDEVDCSHNPDHESIFLPEGNRVFWPDPELPAPTSAVCWNAAVTCSGPGNPFDECHTQDFDENGNVVEVDATEHAVLYPLVRYTSQLAQRGAYVVAIDGVGLDGVPVYANAAGDPERQANYGIGAGCDSVDGAASPPVRIRDVLASVGDPGAQFSVCSSGYESALSLFANGIVARLPQ